MDSRLTRWCNGFLEACWLVAILTVPLFFNIHSDRVFEPDKIALLRSLALLMAAAWIVKFVDGRGWRDMGRLSFSNPGALWHQPFVLPVLVLVIVYLLATIFSVTPRVSWAGSYQRLQGAYTTLSYVVIFAMMAAGLRSAEQVRRVVTVAIVTSVPVAMYGLVQHYGHDPLPWGGNVQNRVAGHLGNAIFIAAYLIMIVPLTLGRILDAFSNILGDEKMAAADVLRAAVYIFVLAIQLLAIYWSGSRGPLIGLGVGLFSFILVLLVSLRDTTRSRESRLRGAVPAFLFLLPSLLALLLSNTVGNLAGPLFALIFFFGVVALSVIAIFILVAARRGWSWLWLGWILLTLFLAGWLLLFNISSNRASALRETPLIGGVFSMLDEWRDLPGIGPYGRMLDPSQTTGREKSGRVRVLIWEGVVDLISPHPPLAYPNGGSDTFNWLRLILGYGPESMYVAYNPFYPPELATVEARNASPDRSHNETFDTLVITGIAGLLAWQALYLAVINFAFRFLGVARTRRDTWMLIGLWGGGASLAAVAALIVNPIYLGVAVPIGVILGVVIYLIYYALFGRSVELTSGDQSQPFAADRLLMNALVAAVLAHYVEIHFGIAISATRLYFFVFAALIFALGYRLRQPVTGPSESAAPPPIPRAGKGKRKAQASRAPEAPTPRADRGRLLVPAILLILLLSILGYGFITYALPPDKAITSPADLSAIEIFRQSLLQNVRRNFADSPFIWMFFVLSWMLGWLIFLAEMIKYGEIRRPPPVQGAPGSRRQLAAGVMLTLGLVGLAGRFLTQPTTMTATLGQGLMMLGAVVCLSIAVVLLLDRPASRGSAVVVAASVAILSFPVAVAGGLISALAMLAGGLLVLWLLWDSSWRGSLLSVGGAVLASIVGGSLIILLLAAYYRSLLFFRTSAGDGTTATLRALEAVNASSMVTLIFGIVIVGAILLGFALSWPSPAGVRRPLTVGNSALSFGSLAVVLLAAIFMMGQTNVRPVQADMVYKRAKPYDDQATNAVQADAAGRREAWDTAIAIYEAAINLAPNEDFYFLFLGRAYLERASVTEDPVDQTDLLARAENLLLKAQYINPLNTDHTANLARLYTRWIGATESNTEKAERLELAEQYYLDALRLSPQNSIIRNEFARLVLEVHGDCDSALAIYEESATIDPFYAAGHLAKANAYISCADGRQAAERDEFYRSAASSLEDALQIDDSNIRAWVQLAEIYRQLGDYEEAQVAVASARAANEPIIFPPAEIDFLAAQVAAGLGNTAEARELAERALGAAGSETAALIETFLDELEP